jgi:ribosomal protein L11 methyltransferase
MKYFEVDFTLTPNDSDARDLLAALAGEAGFETFEETDTGLKGYVQQSLFSEEVLEEVLTDFPFDGTTITYDIREAEDKDWNAQWEQEGFDPIIISNGAIIIHDGRHLPVSVSSQCTEIEIDARLAFGTGTHETTRMVCSTLLEYTPKGRVLDCGTGTGILSICALKLGASEAVGYDIDEWSVDNARHNAVINHVDDRFQSLLGDATILNKVEGVFDIVMANINRNILLADMTLFRKKMATGAFLILSGFYTADIPMLAEKAESLGLTLESQRQDNDWACLVFRS